MSSESGKSEISAASSDCSGEISYDDQKQHIIGLLKGNQYKIPYLEKHLEGWEMGVNPAYETVKADEAEFLKL